MADPEHPRVVDLTAVLEKIESLLLPSAVKVEATARSGSAARYGRGMHPLTRPLNKLVVAVHHWVYERSGGRIGSSLAGQPMLMLYTVGRKSRQRRSSVLPYIRDGDRF